MGNEMRVQEREPEPGLTPEINAEKRATLSSTFSLIVFSVINCIVF